METFLPFPNIEQSVDTYDPLTLVVARKSVLTLLDILHEVEPYPDNDFPMAHPEIAKWKGHEVWLIEYGRELQDTFENVVTPPPGRELDPTFTEKLTWHFECATSGDFAMVPPPWWGNVAYHVAEQAALLRRNWLHYNHLFPGVDLLTPPSWTILHG